MATKKQKKPTEKNGLERLALIDKDLRLAQRRVEKLGVARWLYNFAYSDLNEVSAGELVDRGFDLLALVVPKPVKEIETSELATMVMPFIMLPKSGDMEKMVRLAQAGSTQEAADTNTKIFKSILDALHVPAWLVFDFHKKLREKFDGFFGKSELPWRHDRPAEVKWLAARGVGARGAPSAVIAQSYENPAMLLQPVERLLLIAGEAVLKDQHKFGVCARCKKSFMAEKNPRTIHCSKTCGIYLRVQRYRNK